MHYWRFLFHLSYSSSLQGTLTHQSHGCLDVFKRSLLIFIKLYENRALVALPAVSVSFELTMNQGPGQRPPYDATTFWNNQHKLAPYNKQKIKTNKQKPRSRPAATIWCNKQHKLTICYKQKIKTNNTYKQQTTTMNQGPGQRPPSDATTFWNKSEEKTSQELRMLSLSLFIQGSLWILRFLFSIVRNVISDSEVTCL